MKSIKLKERKIKEDIINEMDIPNVLDKVRPLALNKAQELSEERRTVTLNFHRPAKIFATCLASVVGLFLIIIIGINVAGGKYSSQKYDMENKASSNDMAVPNEDAEYEVGQRDKNTQESSSLPNEKPGTNEFLDFKNSYYESDISNKITENELFSYYSDISTYVNQGKSLEEILEYYNDENNVSYLDSITYIYNYLNK